MCHHQSTGFISLRWLSPSWDRRQSCSIFSCNPRVQIWPHACFFFSAALASWRGQAAAEAPPTWAAPPPAGRSSETRRPLMRHSSGRLLETHTDLRPSGFVFIICSEANIFVFPVTASPQLCGRKSGCSSVKRWGGHVNADPVCLKEITTRKWGERMCKCFWTVLFRPQLLSLPLLLIPLIFHRTCERNTVWLQYKQQCTAVLRDTC